MLVTYQKRNGDIIQRQRNTMLPYKIGEETSMGWIVLNIEYEYNNCYYSEYEYNSLIQKRKNKCIKRNLAREVYIKEIKTFLYYTIAVLIVNLLRSFLGI